ncbi:MAG: Type 4 prepilin-like protein leader peptide-processing enzyme [candidate division TM6 bacterium GW2011_GWF2_30_66]|jgi:leader peptidase (prepilin peptidase)/N-methyltransferase|nr:MAG: Type 4 prepilin-like protein leader peptide-processing enzyme [candidate division TM6 bacterium GW2011_GWF2_30_66]
MLAYRLMNINTILEKRSFCPKCKKIIFWYDNIPVISWIILQAKCRHCKQKISALYPFIEIFTATIFSILYYQLKNTNNLTFLPAYFTFFSALIITFRTDLEFMLISRFVTLFLIPMGLIFSATGLLPINLLNSISGAILGYFILWTVSKIFYYATSKDGIGQGDLELLAFIGSFLGLAGCWISLFIGSVIGSFFGLAYIVITKKSKSVKMPFGHFLAIGAILFVLFGDYLKNLILGI